MDKNNFGKKRDPKYQSQNESQSSMFSIHYRSYNFCKSRKRKNTSIFLKPRMSPLRKGLFSNFGRFIDFFYF